MKRIYLLLACFCVFYYAQAQQFSMVFGGITRTYIVHLPTGYTTTGNYPLVFNFHGLTSNAQQQEYYSGMDAVSNANKFVVVYPNGVNNTWNIGTGSGVNDIGFVNALIDTLKAHYAINLERVYATGFSMGGYFSYRVGCKLSSRIAAIAPVSGNMTGSSSCTPVRSVPVMHIHGTSDPIVSYSGVQPSLNYWRNNNKCTAAAQTTRIPNTNTDLIVYGGCTNGAEVRHYKINGGTHVWPRGSATTINASVEIWNFFSRFTLTSQASPVPIVTATPTATSPAFTATGDNGLTNLKTSLTVHPNPAKDKLRVSFISHTPGEVSISIRDLMKKIEMDVKILATTGENTLEVDISNLQDGLHVLMIVKGNERIAKKVFVAK